MKILGLSGFHRDSAAALVIDGALVAAEKEERFTKRPLEAGFPRRAARACLALAGLRAAELDRVVFYEKPLRKFERVLACELGGFPRSARSFARTMSLWLGERLWLKSQVANELEIDAAKVAFCEHQRAHLAQAFFTSPFERAALLSVDDFGEWATTALGRGEGSELALLETLDFPHSLGLVASAIAQFLGFEPGTGEHEVEALARRGRPRFARELDELVRPLAGGAFEVDARRFRFAFDGERLCDDSLAELFGPPRVPGAKLAADGADARDADLAASLQALLEARVLALAEELARRTGERALGFAGVLAANRTLVARLAREGPFGEVFVPADPDDAGAAAGAALAFHHAQGGSRAAPPGLGGLGLALDGASAGEGEALDRDPWDALAERLLAGELVAWVRGRADFARESLGARSVFADPRRPGARERLLSALRQGGAEHGCRVLAPRERARELFDLPASALPAAALGWVAARPTGAALALAPDLGDVAWPELVERDDPRAGLLERLARAGGAPLAWHATFRLRGAAEVRDELDALDAFRRSTLDALIVGERCVQR